MAFTGQIFLPEQSWFMKQNKENHILWVEAFGFSIIIALSWLSELIRIPYILFREPFSFNWHRALLRTAVVLLVWAWVHLATRKLLKRLHYLEEFLRICGWCRKVCHHDEWLTLEAYFSSKFATRTTHGMCPDCLKKEVAGLEERKNPPAASER
jgi:hypothetical protein